jgi:hypothetical protein
MNTPAHSSGWLLLAGLALAAVGIAAEPQTTGTGTIPPTQGFGTADSNDAMIAVTGMDVTGASILYVIDTERRQLAVYQANGGTSSTMGVRLVGARNIDLDLQLDGYKDKSDYTYKELAREFEKAGSSPPSTEK